ncbi:ABC transporter substrate-binding protein [Geomesophilobacter sediminis]|uniref:ABC transporter substrate-binding protein n=1 Tax=Geomesophilobacter sediminis TaxID=2798584 RepID=A0A8J7LTC6_9BACT|nr:ABC transporter substrate-binding protein [Geomesophilobacter sediminis]MBJ6723239.1 ABC transporter substrate-binding protein [Geomesophilobacter sediminis]
MKKWFVGIVSAFITMLFCGSAFAAGTIRIGGLFAVTGPAAFIGDPAKKTLEMLVKETNRKGGINGMKVETVIYDTGGDPTKAVQLATKLIKEDKVQVIIGPSTTGESMAVIPLVERAKIPMISNAAGGKIVDPVKHWVFKTAASDHIAVEKLLNYVRSKNQKRIAILTVSDGFGTSGREQLKAYAAKQGFTIVADEVFAPKDTDMTAQLTKIRAIKPDAIIAWALNPGMAIITKNVKQLNIKVPLYMSHGTSTNKYLELAGEAAEGVIHPAGKLAIYDSLPKSDPQAKLLKDYHLNYQKQYGEEATTFGGFGYDAYRLIVAAVEKGNTTPEQIRNGIEQAKKIPSVSGIFTMSPKDHNGLDLSSLVMVKITKGKWIMLTK